MSTSGDIRTAIQQIAGVHLSDSVSIFDAEVISVSESSRSAVVRMVDGNMTGDITVRLMASMADGMLCLPSEGSTVTILMSERVQPVILLYSDIDKIVFRGGDLDGLVKVAELTDKLNNLENKVNTIINNFNSHTHVLTLSSGTGTAAPTTTVVSGTLTPTQQADIENENITQG